MRGRALRALACCGVCSQSGPSARKPACQAGASLPASSGSSSLEPSSPPPTIGSFDRQKMREEVERELAEARKAKFEALQKKKVEKQQEPTAALPASTALSPASAHQKGEGAQRPCGSCDSARGPLPRRQEIADRMKSKPELHAAAWADQVSGPRAL